MRHTLPLLALATALLLPACTDDAAPPPTPDSGDRTRPALEFDVRGKGEEIESGDAITLHYRVSLKQGGGLIEDTRVRGGPDAIIVGEGLQVPGLDLALLDMRVGDSCKVTVPWELAYGTEGIPGTIPARSDVIYDVNVLGRHELEMEWVTRGDGLEIEPGSWVQVHYRGTLLDGQQFDSSYDKGKPFAVQVGARQVIRGWEAALLRMRKGDKVKARIPWQLAYGERGMPPTIPRKADLMFEMEAVDVRAPR